MSFELEAEPGLSPVDKVEQQAKIQGFEIDDLAPLDWGELRRRSLEPGGFGNDRVKLWPRLLHVHASSKSNSQGGGRPGIESVNDAGKEPEEEKQTEPQHPDEHQISLDTNRSFVLYPVVDAMDDRISLQKDLNHLLVSIFRKRPKLRYFQGYHDIITVLFLTLPPEMQLICAEKLSLHRVRDSMGKGLEPVLGLLQVMKRLLRLADKEYADTLESTAPLPYYALSNLLTLFSHDMPTLPLIQHVFDYLLSRPPIYVVYLATAIVLSRKEEVIQLEEEGEEGMIHSLLSSLPDIFDAQEEDPAPEPEVQSDEGIVNNDMPPATTLVDGAERPTRESLGYTENVDAEEPSSAPHSPSVTITDETIFSETSTEVPEHEVLTPIWSPSTAVAELEELCSPFALEKRPLPLHSSSVHQNKDGTGEGVAVEKALPRTEKHPPIPSIKVDELERSQAKTGGPDPLLPPASTHVVSIPNGDTRKLSNDENEMESHQTEVKSSVDAEAKGVVDNTSGNPLTPTASVEAFGHNADTESQPDSNPESDTEFYHSHPPASLRPPRISLTSLLQKADDLYAQWPPTTTSLKLSRIMGPQSVVFTWNEDPKRSDSDSETEAMVNHPELVVYSLASDEDEDKEGEDNEDGDSSSVNDSSADETQGFGHRWKGGKGKDGKKRKGDNFIRRKSRKYKRKSILYRSPFRRMERKTFVASAVVVLGIALAIGAHQGAFKTSGGRFGGLGSSGIGGLFMRYQYPPSAGGAGGAGGTTGSAKTLKSMFGSLHYRH